MAHDQHETATGFNVARYFVEHRHISWVLFAGVLAWGVGAYQAMPKRKDPDIPVRQVAVATPWPGQSAERVEQLVTRKIEERIAQNIRVSEIKSRSRAGLSVVYAEVDDSTTNTAKEFDDIKIKLDSLADLPQGAGAPDIVVHCKMGGRSAKAVKLLQDAGFRKVHNLSGGIDRWAAEIDPKMPRY